MFGGIGQGVSDDTRIGDQLTAKGVRLALTFQCTDTFNDFRILMVTARKQGIRYQPSSVASFVQNLLSGAVSAGTQWVAAVDTERFKVYYDKILHLKRSAIDGSSSTTIPESQSVIKTVKLNKKIKFDEEGQITNDLYLIMLSDSGAVSHPGAIAGYVTPIIKIINL